MMTADQYIQSLRDLGPRNVYVLGKKVDNIVDHPMIPSFHQLLRHDLQAGRISGI